MATIEPTGDGTPLFSALHPQRTPLWKRILFFWRRPRFSEDAIIGIDVGQDGDTTCIVRGKKDGDGIIISDIHFCKEDPCPERDKEAAKILQNGFGADYTKGLEGMY